MELPATAEPKEVHWNLQPLLKVSELAIVLPITKVLDKQETSKMQFPFITTPITLLLGILPILQFATVLARLPVWLVNVLGPTALANEAVNSIIIIILNESKFVFFIILFLDNKLSEGTTYYSCYAF